MNVPLAILAGTVYVAAITWVCDSLDADQPTRPFFKQAHISALVHSAILLPGKDSFGRQTPTNIDIAYVSSTCGACGVPALTRSDIERRFPKLNLVVVFDNTTADLRKFFGVAPKYLVYASADLREFNPGLFAHGRVALRLDRESRVSHYATTIEELAGWPE